MADKCKQEGPAFDLAYTVNSLQLEERMRTYISRRGGFPGEAGYMPHLEKPWKWSFFSPQVLAQALGIAIDIEGVVEPVVMSPVQLVGPHLKALGFVGETSQFCTGTIDPKQPFLGPCDARLEACLGLASVTFLEEGAASEVAAFSIGSAPSRLRIEVPVDFGHLFSLVPTSILEVSPGSLSMEMAWLQLCGLPATRLVCELPLVDCVVPTKGTNVWFCEPSSGPSKLFSSPIENFHVVCAELPSLACPECETQGDPSYFAEWADLTSWELAFPNHFKLGEILSNLGIPAGLLDVGLFIADAYFGHVRGAIGALVFKALAYVGLKLAWELQVWKVEWLEQQPLPVYEGDQSRIIPDESSVLEKQLLPVGPFVSYHVLDDSAVSWQGQYDGPDPYMKDVWNQLYVQAGQIGVLDSGCEDIAFMLDWLDTKWHFLGDALFFRWATQQLTAVSCCWSVLSGASPEGAPSVPGSRLLGIRYSSAHVWCRHFTESGPAWQVYPGKYHMPLQLTGPLPGVPDSVRKTHLTVHIGRNTWTAILQMFVVNLLNRMWLESAGEGGPLKIQEFSNFMSDTECSGFLAATPDMTFKSTVTMEDSLADTSAALTHVGILGEGPQWIVHTEWLLSANCTGNGGCPSETAPISFNLDFSVSWEEFGEMRVALVGTAPTLKLLGVPLQVADLFGPIGSFFFGTLTSVAAGQDPPLFGPWGTMVCFWPVWNYWWADADLFSYWPVLPGPSSAESKCSFSTGAVFRSGPVPDVAVPPIDGSSMTLGIHGACALSLTEFYGYPVAGDKMASDWYQDVAATKVPMSMSLDIDAPLDHFLLASQGYHVVLAVTQDPLGGLLLMLTSLPGANLYGLGDEYEQRSVRATTLGAMASFQDWVSGTLRPVVLSGNGISNASFLVVDPLSTNGATHHAMTMRFRLKEGTVYLDTVLWTGVPACSFVKRDSWFQLDSMSWEATQVLEELVQPAKKQKKSTGWSKLKKTKAVLAEGHTTARFVANCTWFSRPTFRWQLNGTDVEELKKDGLAVEVPQTEVGLIDLEVDSLSVRLLIAESSFLALAQAPNGSEGCRPLIEREEAYLSNIKAGVDAPEITVSCVVEEYGGGCWMEHPPVSVTLAGQKAQVVEEAVTGPETSKKAGPLKHYVYKGCPPWGAAMRAGRWLSPRALCSKLSPVRNDRRHSLSNRRPGDRSDS